MRMCPVVPRALAAALVLAGASTPATTAAAQPGPVVAPTAVEAWYNIAPLAAPGLPPLNPYPPSTLHVGVTGGSEDSRTYLTLDLSRVPAGSTITGGVLILPVDPDGGTRNLEDVGMEVCLAPDPGVDAEGSLEPPPPVDCSVRSPAVLDEGADRPRFRVDLAPFAARLADGGLALLASDATQADGASWHVALYRRDNEAAEAVPITATLELGAPGDDAQGGAEGAPAPTDLGDEGTSDATGVRPPAQGSSQPQAGPLADFGLPGDLAAPSATDIDPPATDTGQAPPLAGGAASAQPVAIGGPLEGGGFRYGVVFVLPLALLVFVWYFGSALTADPASEPEPPIST